jgi:hypothetical protein
MTQGFYKLVNDELSFGPNGVTGPNVDLVKELKDAYEYPVDGWYWFDSEQAAKEFWNLS